MVTGRLSNGVYLMAKRATAALIGGQWSLIVVNAASGATTHLLTSNLISGAPIWLSDDRIVFPVTNMTGLAHQLYVANPDGSGAQALTPPEWYVDNPVLWR